MGMGITGIVSKYIAKYYFFKLMNKVTLFFLIAKIATHIIQAACGITNGIALIKESKP